jgi:Hsp90 protein
VLVKTLGALLGWQHVSQSLASHRLMDMDFAGSRSGSHWRGPQDTWPAHLKAPLLQESRVVRIIRKQLVKRCMDMMTDLVDQAEEAYEKFWSQFGRNVKLGVVDDPENKEKLASLLRVCESLLPVCAKHLGHSTGHHVASIQNPDGHVDGDCELLAVFSELSSLQADGMCCAVQVYQVWGSADWP